MQPGQPQADQWVLTLAPISRTTAPMPCPPSMTRATAAVFRACGQTQWPFLTVRTSKPQPILDVPPSSIPAPPVVASIWPTAWEYTPFVSRAPRDNPRPTGTAQPGCGVFNTGKQGVG